MFKDVSNTTMLFPIFIHSSNIFILMFMNSPCKWPIKEWHPPGNLRFLNQCIFQRGVLRSKEVEWLLWSKPMMGMVKMNTEGSCKGSSGASGAIFAVLQVGFYMVLVFLLHKVILCGGNLMLSMNEFFGANGWMLEILRLKRIVVLLIICSWNLSAVSGDIYCVRKILKAIDVTRCIKLIYREENRVTDSSQRWRIFFRLKWISVEMRIYLLIFINVFFSLLAAKFFNEAPPPSCLLLKFFFKKKYS